MGSRTYPWSDWFDLPYSATCRGIQVIFLLGKKIFKAAGFGLFFDHHSHEKKQMGL